MGYVIVVMVVMNGRRQDHQRVLFQVRLKSLQIVHDAEGHVVIYGTVGCPNDAEVM